ncbi:MAG: galactofuranosyltransferase, partial [Odoribacteraceae bacterium]|nr:galactofuranosyltransferase [Odoribacteraceae bacterium]
MKTINGHYISKNYRAYTSAASKAKIDCEEILQKNGYVNIGLPRTIRANETYGFFRNLFSVLLAVVRARRGVPLVLQYPLKKYYPFLCRVARWRGCPVITIIHDLRSLRRKKMIVDREIRDLNRSPVLIAHNEKMKEWLHARGCRSRVVVLSIFDYLSDAEPLPCPFRRPVEIVFAGTFSHKRSSFPAHLDPDASSFLLNMYGRPGDIDALSGRPVIRYKGVFDADVLISKIEGHFGLIWDGPEVTTCAGGHGEYLLYNNPHKTSLYLRCHLPVIIWSRSALAPFIREHRVGLLVDSLEELEQICATLSREEYLSMQQNTRIIAERLKNGAYLTEALA